MRSVRGACDSKTERGDRMGIELPEHQRRIQKAQMRLGMSVGEMLQKTCSVDGVALVRGRCPVCGLDVKKLLERRAAENESRRKPEPEEDETESMSAKELAFWERLRKQRHEREAAM